jgi:protein-tyrosine-phosphatase
MAEKIFKNMLKQNNVKGVMVSSAGIGAHEGIEMTLMAKRALKKVGINAGAHKSKQLKEILSDTIYITMTENEKNYLNKKNVLTFAQVVDVANHVEDPQGKTQQDYDNTAHQLHYYCGLLLSKIKKI